MVSWLETITLGWVCMMSKGTAAAVALVCFSALLVFCFVVVF